MGRLELAMKMADEFGTTVDDAMKFVDDVGPGLADDALAAADDAAGKLDAFKPGGMGKIAIGTGAIGGGALLWREQDVRQAQAIADSSESYSEGVSNIINSDLPAEVKKELLKKFLEGGGGNAGGENGDGGLLGDDMTKLVIMAIVVIVILQYVLSGGIVGGINRMRGGA